MYHFFQTLALYDISESRYTYYGHFRQGNPTHLWMKPAVC